MTRRLAVTLLTLLPVAAHAQSGVAPPHLSLTWGNAGVHVPLGQSIYRWQMLVPAGLLPPGLVPGRQIERLGLRMIPATAPVPANQVDTEIRLYNVALTATTFAASFGHNRAAGAGGVVRALRPLSLPATAAARGPGTSFVDIALDAPFVFTGPALLLELVGADVANRFTGWVNDSCLGQPAGGRVPFGSPCGPTGNQIDSQGASPLPYLPGTAVTVFQLNGPRGQPVALLVGDDLVQTAGLPLPLDLAALAAPGCHLLVAPVVVLGGVTNPLGFASRALSIPADPALAGTALGCQWLNGDATANAAGISLSAGLGLTIGPVQCGVATTFRLDDNLDTVGLGPYHDGPVVRLAWR